MAQASKQSLPRLLVTILVVIVVLIGIAWGALVVFFPPAKVRALVQRQLAGVLAREARFDGASVGLFPPVRLTIRAPALAEPGGFARGAAFQARSIHLDLDALRLLGGKIVVRRLVLDEPRIHLVQREDGTTNLDNLVKPAPPGRPPAKPMDLSIDEFQVNDGRLLIDDLKANRRTALTVRTKMSLATNATRVRTSGSTMLSQYAFGPMSATRLSDLNSSLSQLTLGITHSGAFDSKQKRLALSQLELALGQARIGLSGIVDDPGPHARLDLKAKGSGVDVGDLLGYLAAADAAALHGIHGGGKLDFDLAIRGALAPDALPAITGQLALARGSFRYPGAAAGADGVSFHVRFAPDSLGIPDIVGRVAGQPVRGRLVVMRFKDPWVVFALQGNVDLAAIAPMVAPKNMKLAGRAALDVSGRGRAKDPGSIGLDGQAKLADVSVESPDLPQKIHSVQGDIRFSQALATVKGFSARAGKSAFVLDATVTRPLALLANPAPKTGTPVPPSHVDFALASTYLDLAELLPVTPGAPIAPNATGGGRVTIARLKNQKVDVSDVQAQVGLEPGIVSVPSFSLAGYDGRIAGKARFDLRNPQNPGFSIQAKAESLQAASVLTTWTGAKNFIRGAVNTDIDLSGSGAEPAAVLKTLTAVGLALVANGQLGPGPALEAIADVIRVPAVKEMHFKDLRMPFRVERGRVVTDEATIVGPYGKWVTTGGIGFDGAMDYVVSITLPPDVVQRLGAKSALAVGAVSDRDGNLLIDLRVTGTAKAPRVALDGRSMRDRLLGKVSEALEAQKDKLQDDARNALADRQRAAQDSLRNVLARQQQALADSLRRRAKDVLGGFFGGGAKKDTAARPPATDTTHTP